MPTYANKTTVSSEKTRNDIESTLRRYGATQFAYASADTQAVIMFTARNRKIKFLLNLPDRNSRRFTHTPERGALRTKTAAAAEYEQAIRQSWRALLLLVKAKLEAVESGITSWDEEFFAHLVLANGRTLYEHTATQVLPALNAGADAPFALQIEA